MRIVRLGYILGWGQVGGVRANHVISLTNQEKYSFIQFSTGFL